MLSLYREIEEIAACMLDAARRGDWEALVAAEGECRSRVEMLQGMSPEASALSDAEEQRRIIGSVLAAQTEVRALAWPWIARLKAGLESTGNQRRLDSTYGERS